MSTQSECLHPKTYISIAGTTVCRTCYQQVLVATADWTGSTRKDAEIARLRAALERLVLDFDLTIGCPAMQGVTANFGGREAARAALAPEEVSGRSCVQCESFLGHPSFGPCEHRPTGGQR